MMIHRLAPALLVVFLLAVALHAAPTQTLPSDTNASINDANNTLGISPDNLTVYAPPNGHTDDSFEVLALLPGNSGLNVTVSREGDIADWITFDGAGTVDFYVQPGEERVVNFTVTVPPSTSGMLYHANITVNSSFGELKKLNLTVNVTQGVGAINVTVKSSIGDPISGASVFIWTPLNVLKDTGTTGSNGTYLSKWLLPGNYTVEATAAGYNTNTANATVHGNLNVTDAVVVLEPTGAPVLEVSPSSISESAYTGDQVTKTLIISNTGDLSLVNVSLNTSVSWISFSKGKMSSIPASGNEYVTVYIGPLGAVGTYSGSITVASENDGNETMPVSFDVRSRPSGGEAPSGGAAPPSGGIPPPVREIELTDFPEGANASVGETKLIGVGVKNKGDATISGVSVSAAGPFEVRVSPETAGILPELTKTFLLSIEVPADAEPGTYSFVVVASGGGVSDTKTLHLEVIPLRDEGVEKALSGTIHEMRQLVDQLWGEAVRLGFEGYDVEGVFSVLQNATRKLNSAEGSLELGNYPASRLEIERMKALAEEAVKEMAMLKAVTVVEQSPVAYLPAAVACVALVVVLSQFSRLKKELKRRDKIYTALLTTFNLKRPEPQRENPPAGQFGSPPDSYTR